MYRWLKLIVLFFCISSTFSWATSPPQLQLNKNQPLEIALFLSSTCPYCHKAEEFFTQLENTLPWIAVHRYVINQNIDDLKIYYNYLQTQQLENFSVPAVFFCNSRWIILDDKARQTEMLRALTYCHQQILEKGELTPVTTTLLKRWADANSLTLAVKPAAHLKVGFFLALFDALSSSGLFTMLAFVAFLILARIKKNQILLGLEFLGILAIVHYLQQNQFIYMQQSLPHLRLPTIFVGLALVTYLTTHYFNRYSYKRSVLALMIVGLSALFLQIYQSSDNPNNALIFDQWLRMQALSGLEVKCYELYYQFIYCLPLVFLLFLMVFIKPTNYLIASRRLVNDMAILFLTIIGVLFIFYPHALSSGWVAIGSLVFSFINAYFLNRLRPQTDKHE